MPTVATGAPAGSGDEAVRCGKGGAGDGDCAGDVAWGDMAGDTGWETCNAGGAAATSTPLVGRDRAPAATAEYERMLTVLSRDEEGVESTRPGSPSRRARFAATRSAGSTFAKLPLRTSMGLGKRPVGTPYRCNVAMASAIGSNAWGCWPNGDSTSTNAQRVRPSASNTVSGSGSDRRSSCSIQRLMATLSSDSFSK